MSAHPRSSPPSVRFWDSRRNTIGVILTLVAALFSLAITIWPIVVPQGQTLAGISWGLARVLGLLYLAAFFLADRRWTLARWLLIGGGIGQLAIGIISGPEYSTIAGPSGLYVSLFHLAPAILALAAAFFLGPPPRRAGMPEDRSEPVTPELKEHLPFGHDDDRPRRQTDVRDEDRPRRQADEDRREVRASAGRTATSADAMGFNPSDAERSEQVEPGMYVVTSDGDEIGQVKEVRLGDFLVDRRDGDMLYVPHNAIQAVDGDRLRLDVASNQIDDMSWENPTLTSSSRPDR
jgi:hypothetical protein